MANIDSGVRELLKNEFGIDADTVNGFGVQYDVISTILNVEEEAALFKGVWDAPEKIDLMSSNIPKILDELSKFYLLHIRTATMGDKRKIRAWLKKKRVKYDEIEFVSKKDDKIRDDIHVYVDDHPELVKRMAQSGKRVVLIRHPYNIYIEKELPKYGGRIFIANDWNDAYRILQSINSNIFTK